MDDDDPWMDEELSDPVILQRNTAQEWESLSSKFSDAGYRDGIGEGKASTAQRGFDEGYSKTGFPIGRELGVLRGVAANLLAYLTASNNSSSSTSSSGAMPNGTPSDGNDQASLVGETRNIVRLLGKIRLVDLAPRDLEAEEHARSHGEEIELPMELQDKRDMESLEDSLESMGGGNSRNGTTQVDRRAELETCKSTLKTILERLGMRETASML